MANLDYSEYTFDSVVAQLQVKLAATETWKDTYRSGAGQMLIELFAYVADLDGYKTERRAEELYLDFAKLRSSVVALAALVGYTPRRKVSAVATERFASAVVPVTIPKGAVVTSAGGVAFVTMEEGTILTDTVDIPIQQGEAAERSEVSNEAENQSYEVPSDGSDVEAVENTSLEVRVDGILWTAVDSFVSQDSTDEVYVLERDGAVLRVSFGDGTNGKVPPLNDSIIISWIKTLGSTGNVYGTDTITTVGDGVPAGVTATNTEPALGGEDEEGIEEVRVNAPRVFSTGDRAVTRADFKALLLAFPGVAKAEAYGEQELLTGDSNPDYAWKVLLVVVPSGGGVAGKTLEDLIIDYLDDKKLITTQIVFQDPTYIEVDFVSEVVSLADFDSTTVQAAIEAVLDSLLSLQNTDLGESLRYSDVIAAIDGVEGVDHHLTDVFVAEDIGTGDGIEPTFTGTLPLTPVDRSNIQIYTQVGDTLTRQGYDDGEGNIVGVGIGSGDNEIDYETGEISVSFSTAPASGAVVRIRYQTGTADRKVIGTADGVTTDFTGILNRSVSRSTVEIYREDILVAADDGSGNLVDDGDGEVFGGTVNYVSGDIEVVFTVIPPDGNGISVKYHFENQDIIVSLDKILEMGLKNVSVTQGV